MRIKNFTLMTLALLMMSVVTFAQKPAEKQRLVTPLQKALEFQRSDHLEKEDFSALEFNHNVLPQFMQKTEKVNVPASLKAKVNPVSKKSPKQEQLQTMAQERATSTVKPNKLLSPSWGQGSFSNRSIVKRAAPEGSLFFDDFEGGDLSNWTLYTQSEGDGWISGTPEAYGICEAKSGDYVASSWSWNNSSYDVDNWLITPKVALGGSVVFWTYTSQSYPDKYEVLLSTTGTETTDFTVSLKPMAADAGGAWERHVLDLSEYDGQEGYVAIHHQDYDMNYLLIDDFAITEEPYVAPTPVTPPTDLQTIPFTILAYDSDEDPFERVLNIGVDGTDVYLQGASYYLPDAWIKGTLNQNGTVTFATGQYCGEDGIYPVYLQAYDNNTSTTLDNLTISYNILTGSITWPDVLIMDCGSPEGLDELYQYYEVVQVKPGIAPDPLTPPAGIENSLVEYRMEGDAYDSDGDPMTYCEPIFIGINGTDVWVKGVCMDFPDTWIKGTLNGNTVTFPTGQHFATYDPYEGTYNEGYYIYKFFFAGYDINSGAQADVTMTLDSNTGIYTMTSPDILMINSEWLISDPNIFFLTAQFVPVADEATTPAQPEITDATLTGSYPNVGIYIPIEDEDGNPILTSKLYYKFYYDVEREVYPLTLSATDYKLLAEDLDEIPYTFTDNYDIYNYRLYLNMDVSIWNKIGIQSIYYGGEEENASEIFWYTLKPYENQHDIVFSTEGEYTIQNGGASVIVEGEDVTENVNEKGKLPAIDEDFTVTLQATPGFKLLGLEASYNLGGGGLTVFDGTATNGYVPVYGFYGDAYLKSEFVMPAEALADMANESISSMSFYLASPASAAWTATFQVFMKEIDATTLDAYTGTDGATVVYEGALDATGETLDIDFTTPYEYQGGNLLIGIYSTQTGNYKSASFYGKTVQGASVQGYSYSGPNAVSVNQRNFLPKTTFAYGSPASDVNLEIDLDPKGAFASFVMPNAKVNVTYELERLGYPVEVAAGKYMTYFTDKAITIYDEDCELLTVTAVDDATVTATPLNVAAAKTPLLIYNSSDKKKELWIVPTEDATEELTPDEVEVAPEFKGTIEEKTFTAAEMSAAEHFICNGEAFIWVRSAGTIGANKCWLELGNDEPSTARSIVIGSGETTGVKAVDHSPLTIDNYYDLQGRRVAQPAKGLYINNGKKVVVK